MCIHDYPFIRCDLSLVICKFCAHRIIFLLSLFRLLRKYWALVVVYVNLKWYIMSLFLIDGVGEELIDMKPSHSRQKSTHLLLLLLLLPANLFQTLSQQDEAYEIPFFLKSWGGGMWQSTRAHTSQWVLLNIFLSLNYRKCISLSLLPVHPLFKYCNDDWNIRKIERSFSTDYYLPQLLCVCV